MIHPRRVLWNAARASGITLAALCCCACAGLRTPPTVGSVENENARVVDASANESARSRNSASSRESRLEAPGTFRLSKQPTSVVSTAKEYSTELPTMNGIESAEGNAIQQVGFTDPKVETLPVAAQPFSITECPPEPRWAAPCPNPMAMGMVCGPCESGVLPEKFPDEYLCDGGDRALPVHYDNFNRNGLDTEDTVAEFTDHTGKQRMKPSNRVCVYAPRFSTIRTVSRPYEDSKLDEVGGVDHSSGSNTMHMRLKASNHVKNVMSGRVAVRSRASGLESEQLQGNVSQTKVVAVHEKLLNVYQDLNFVQFGKFERTEAARLNFGIKASLIWSREEYPVIAAKTDAAMTGTYEAHAATIVGIDDKKSDTPGDLRVVKLADKQTGQTGDEIEFTIRYDNLGPNTVHHVRITDNLTPRLQYVEDSATSDRDGRLVVQDNGEGSLVLTWELLNPLPANTGGVVTFKAKIR